ncbi:hypothetical protein D3C71_1902300 [compost metagenome]
MLAHQRVVAFGHLKDEFVCAGQLRGLHHGFQRRAGIGECDVLADAAIEQHVLLQHDANLAA